MIEELCRLCGKENNAKLNVFSDICAEQKLNFKIKEVVRLNIMKEDPLPKVICLPCIEHLEKAFYFYNQCHQTQIHLMELFQSHVNNYEGTISNESCTERNERNVKPSVSNDTPLEAKTIGINSNLKENTIKNLQKMTSNLVGVFDASITKTHEVCGSAAENHIETLSSRTSITKSDVIFTSDSSQTESLRTNRTRLKRKCSIDTPIIDELEVNIKNNNPDIFNDFNENEKSNDSDDTFDMSNEGDDSDLEFLSRTRRNFKKTKPPKQINKKISPTTNANKSRTSRSMKKEAENRKAKKRLSCATCKMTFTQELTYQEHLNVHTGNRPFSCKLCEASFRKRQELNQHLRTIHSEKQFKCPLCDHIAKHKGKLTEHMKSVHEKPFACDLCNYRTGEKGKIMQHIANKHTGDLSYVCEICGNGFKTKTSLQTHRQNIHFPEPKVCQTCGTVCPSLARYSAHIFRCGKEKKRFPCEKCGKTYVNKEILKDHMNKHLNVRPYKCDVCGKEFFQRNRLDTHKYVHRGAAYRCEICNQSFNRKDNMKNHMKKHFYKSMRYDNMIVTAV